MADIMIAGTGGQGVLTAGKLLMEIAAENGKNVCWTSEYSAEMRGGTALSRVVVSDEDIGSPYPDLLDVLCSMNEASYQTYGYQLRKGSTLIFNSAVFTPEQVPAGVDAYGVDAVGLAAEQKNPRGANLVVLGAMIRATGMIDKDAFVHTLREYFEQKGKNSDANVACFYAGYDHAQKLG